MLLETELQMPPKNAEAIAAALSGDKDSKRSRTSFAVGDNGLRVTINADDAVAMRAAINSQLRLVNSCLKCLKVIENG